VDPRVLAATRTLTDCDGAMRIDDVAAAAGTTGRHLERLFQREIGTTPKRFARVLRFQAAANQMLNGDTSSLVDVSADAGYFDQAHMVREFVSFAGTTPGQFKKKLGALTRVMLS
jgi:transcriptional regulator GlxA family with amidase domain